VTAAPDPARERCWIAERDGQRLGCVFLAKEDLEAARVRLLLVEPAARGSGLGRQLTEAAVGFARRAGYREVVLWTHKELHAARVPGRAPLLTGLSTALLAARATGKVILDGVYNDVQDLAGFEAEARQGRELGFDGKTLIHPRQLEPCNRVFAPAPEDVEHSRRIIAAFEEATSQGRGVVTVDGRMIENLHVEEARRVLALAAAVAGR